MYTAKIAAVEYILCNSTCGRIPLEKPKKLWYNPTVL